MAAHLPRRLAPVPTTLFVSDLHLCPSRPGTCALFLNFLERQARGAEALYILGDLFEYWAGDDDLGDPFNAAIGAGLARLAGSGTAVHFLAGNRDFLIGPAFAAATGVTLLDEPCLVTIAGLSTLLLHGDSLCTDDADYQRFRTQVRSADWRRNFLGQPLAARKAQIEAMRTRSESEKRRKPMAIMDVNAEAVSESLRQAGWPPRLVHGHTHRPARHALTVDGRHCERWVLAAWDDTPAYLAVDASGCHSRLAGD
jgi:UDP-2,3-diacylglucosamine hydrolase